MLLKIPSLKFQVFLAIDFVTIADLPSIKLIEFRNNSMTNFVEAHASSR